MKKMLLIVDAQYDFIDGSLAVDGAISAMNDLTQYVMERGNEYDLIVFTQDWHPITHCSFMKNEGEWPTHCVENTHGAEIWKPLVDAAFGTNKPCLFLHKGTIYDREEYSIFKNFESAATIIEEVKAFSIEQIDLCGIAKDFCVFDTLKDGIKRMGGNMFNVLKQFTPSITEDGSKKFDEFLIENEIKSKNP